MSQRFPNANYPEAYPEANMGKADGVAVNQQRLEIQSVETDATGGDFTLSYLGAESAAIAWDADAAAVKAALELLATITTVNVTGGDLPAAVLVEFVDPGPFKTKLLVADDTGLTGDTIGSTIFRVQAGSVVVAEATGAPL